MSKILKYKLALTEYQVLQIPAECSLLKLANQKGVPTLWVLDENSSVSDVENLEIVMATTGQEFDSSCLSYLSTVFIRSGVYHFFIKC